MTGNSVASLQVFISKPFSEPPHAIGYWWQTSQQTLDESQSKLMNERNGGFLNRGTPHQFHGRIVHVNHPAIGDTPGNQGFWLSSVVMEMCCCARTSMGPTGRLDVGLPVEEPWATGEVVTNPRLPGSQLFVEGHRDIIWHDVLFSWNIDIIYFTYVIYIFIHAGIYVSCIYPKIVQDYLCSLLCCVDVQCFVFSAHGLTYSI